MKNVSKSQPPQGPHIKAPDIKTSPIRRIAEAKSVKEKEVIGILLSTGHYIGAEGTRIMFEVDRWFSYNCIAYLFFGEQSQSDLNERRVF